MKIIRAKIMGFCDGVREAYQMSQFMAPASIIGELVHNKSVNRTLANNNISLYHEGQPVSNINVIIPAHGIPLLMEDDIRQRGANVVDCTCKNIKAIQYKVSTTNNNVILIGDKNHSEVKSIISYVKTKIYVVNTIEDIIDVHEKLKGEIVDIYSQTTITREHNIELVSAYEQLCSKDEKGYAHAYTTMCNATLQRQEALKELIRFSNVKAIIVAGDKHSSNVNRLYETCFDLETPAWIIERPEEIPKEVFDFDVIGLTAGASTPDDIIDDIEDALNGLYES